MGRDPADEIGRGCGREPARCELVEEDRQREAWQHLGRCEQREHVLHAGLVTEQVRQKPLGGRGQPAGHGGLADRGIGVEQGVYDSPGVGCTRGPQRFEGHDRHARHGVVEPADDNADRFHSVVAGESGYRRGPDPRPLVSRCP